MSERKNRHLYTEHKMGAVNLDKKYHIRDPEGMRAVPNRPGTDLLETEKDRNSRKSMKPIVDNYIPRYHIYKEAIGPIGSDWTYNPFGKNKFEISYDKRDFSEDKKLNEDNKIKSIRREIIDPNTILPVTVPPLVTMKARNRNK